MLILQIIVAIIIVDFLLERILSVLNQRNWSSEVPQEVKGIYPEEKYRTSQQYKKENDRVGLISSTISFAVTLGMICFGGFAWVDDLVRVYFNNPIAVALVFFGIIMLASSIISLPVSWYSVFVIEQKYGFNRSTVKTFVLDLLKGALMSVIIGGGLLSLIMWIYQITTINFWWMAWALVSAFTIFMTMFYSSLIVPLFNKQVPLEKGELRDAIEEFSKRVGFGLDNIFVMDGSKRSSKANAYFSGLGSRKRIVLFDTLINDLTTEEIVAVLAHEIGHYKKKHTLSGIFISLLQMGLMFFLLGLFVGSPQLSEALGSSIPSFHLGLIAFGLLYSPLSTLMGVGMNVLSRSNEYEADAFAKEHYNGDDLASALKKLSVNSLSNLTPHPAYVYVHYSHPTLLQRLGKL